MHIAIKYSRRLEVARLIRALNGNCMLPGSDSGEVFVAVAGQEICGVLVLAETEEGFLLDSVAVNPRARKAEVSVEDCFSLPRIARVPQGTTPSISTRTRKCRRIGTCTLE